MIKLLRIAVTGGSGKIGRMVVKELVSRGHWVVNLDRLQPVEPLGQFACVDLRDRAQVQPWLEKVEAVAHLAEIPNARAGPAPEEIFAHNTRVGSIVLQTAAELKLRRVIYTSSCQVYGFWSAPMVPPLNLPMDETHPLRPQNIYALAKQANESFAQLVSRDHGLSVAIFRFPWVMTDPWTEDRWQLFQKPMGPMEGCGTYIHGSDAALAYALAIENLHPGCQAYHFCAAEVMSNRPLRDRLREYHPDYPLLPNDWPAFKSPVLTDKAREHFSWKPAWNALDLYRQRFGREPSA